VSAESEIDVNISKTSQFLVRYADAETPDHPDHDVKLIKSPYRVCRSYRQHPDHDVKLIAFVIVR